MSQPLGRSGDVRSTSRGEEEAKQEALGSEFTTVNISPAHAPSPASQVQKHGLHGLFAGLPPDSSRQRMDARKKSPPPRVQVPAPVPAPLESAGLDLGVELRSLAKHYGVGACVVVLSRDGGIIQVLARHGVDFDVELSSLEGSSSFGFSFFRHHIARDLPIVLEDASKQRGLEGHPLVVGFPFIAFYAAAPLIVGPFAYAGTLSILDSRPRHGFTLEDCEVLQRVASKIAEVVGRMR